MRDECQAGRERRSSENCAPDACSRGLRAGADERSSENCAPGTDVLQGGSLRGAHFSEMRQLDEEMRLFDERRPSETRPRASSPCLPPAPRFYSPRGRIRVWRGDLPHWQQEDVAVFLTLRTADSLPKEAILRLAELRDAWREALPSSCDADERDFVRRQRTAMEKWLDADHGSCPFRGDGTRLVIESALRHYDGVRYTLYAFVVMPNHLHLLLTPLPGERTEDVIAALKRFLSRTIGWKAREKGPLWQREYYDTLMRDQEHFTRTRNYIFRNNPKIAWDVYREVRRSSENCAPGVCSRGLRAGVDERSSENCAPCVLTGVQFSELHHDMSKRTAP